VLLFYVDCQLYLQKYDKFAILPNIFATFCQKRHEKVTFEPFFVIFDYCLCRFLLFCPFFMPFCLKTNIENGGFCGSNPAFFGIFGLFSASRLPTVVWQPTDPKPLTR